MNNKNLTIKTAGRSMVKKQMWHHQTHLKTLRILEVRNLGTHCQENLEQLIFPKIARFNHLLALSLSSSLIIKIRKWLIKAIWIILQLQKV